MKLLLNFYNDEITVGSGKKARKLNVKKMEGVREIRQIDNNIVITQVIGPGAMIETRNLLVLSALADNEEI